MTRKTSFARPVVLGVAILAAGIATGLAAGGSFAAAPKFKPRFDCWPHFTRSKGWQTYSCDMTVGNICREGYIRNLPTVKRIKPQLWRVSYICAREAK